MKKKNVLLLLSAIASLSFAFGLSSCDFFENLTGDETKYEYTVIFSSVSVNRIFSKGLGIIIALHKFFKYVTV